MILKVIFIQAFLLINFVRVEDETDASDLKTERERGIAIALNAMDIFINGDKPGTKTYKDLFIDTSKTVFDQIENANVQVTIDDMLRFLKCLFLI
jgi:hypothetical protein